VKGATSRFFRRSESFPDKLDELQQEIASKVISPAAQTDILKNMILDQIADELATESDLREFNKNLLRSVQHIASVAHQVGASQNYGSVNQQGSGAQTNIIHLPQVQRDSRQNRCDKYRPEMRVPSPRQRNQARRNSVTPVSHSFLARTITTE